MSLRRAWLVAIVVCVLATPAAAQPSAVGQWTTLPSLPYFPINVILLPMAFLSGGFGPTAHYPRVLRAIGDVLPLKYFVQLVYAIYLRGHGIWSKPGAIAVLAAWGVAGAAVALRRFRWEPSEG